MQVLCVFVVAASWRAASPGNAYLSCSVDKSGPQTKNEHHTNWLQIRKQPFFLLYFVYVQGFVTHHHQHVFKPFNGLPIGPSARHEGRQDYTAGKQKVAFRDEPVG